MQQNACRMLQYSPGGRVNSENCLDLIFAAPSCEKVLIVSDTNYITSVNRKFMPSPGSFQNIGLSI